MIDAPVQKTISLSGNVRHVDISNDGGFALATYPQGYAIIIGDEVVHRKGTITRARIIREKESFVVAENHSLLFFNNHGALLWRNNYDSKIIDFSFTSSEGLVLLENGDVVALSNFKIELWKITVPGAKRVIIDPTGRNFAVITDKEINFYTFNNHNLQWNEGFMDNIHHVYLNRGSTRIAVSLVTGDFYLLSKSGKTMLEYKFKKPPVVVLDRYGNVIVGEENYVKIMNERGTVLKKIEFSGMCNELKVGYRSDYSVCGTSSGMVYFFDRSGVLWQHHHNEPIGAVNMSDSGDYVIAANSEVIIFNNLSYYVSVIRDMQKKIAAVPAKDPRREKLSNIIRKMKGAYLKRDFKLLLNLANAFDSLYTAIERNTVKFALILADSFSVDTVSKCQLYVATNERVSLKVYGDVKYGVRVVQRVPGKTVISILLQPKHSGKLSVRIDVFAGAKKISIPVTIFADGILRKKRVISNTDFRRLIS